MTPRTGSGGAALAPEARPQQTRPGMGSLRRAATVAFAVLTWLAVVAPADAQPRRRMRVVDVCESGPGVKLVTMGVGSLIWERHGHIALCDCFPEEQRSQNVCYNYGIGDFQHPLQMGWGFFRANDSFWVGKQDPEEMAWIYQYNDRTIWVQSLPLTAAQQKLVIDKLELDVLEENKHYSYDHFWDNCTTRVRDVIDDATGGALRSMTEKTDGRTIRDLAREGFYGIPNSQIALLITDIAMGRVTDHVPSYWERMFLPDYLREAVQTKWGIEPRVIYQRQGAPAQKDGPSGRLWFALIAVLLTAPAWATRLWGRFQRTGLVFAVIPPVLLGLVFWGLAIISPLPYVRWNETCLTLMPFDLLLLVLPVAKRQAYAKGRVIMLVGVAALLLVNVLKAPIWPTWLWALIPNLVVAFLPTAGFGGRRSR